MVQGGVAVSYERGTPVPHRGKGKGERGKEKLINTTNTAAVRQGERQADRRREGSSSPKRDKWTSLSGPLSQPEGWVGTRTSRPRGRANYRGTSLIRNRPPPLGPAQGPRHRPTVGP